MARHDMAWDGMAGHGGAWRGVAWHEIFDIAAWHADQEAMIAAFEKQHRESHRFWKICISLILLAYASFMVHGVISLVASPWGQ
ncbi:unnamed protein product, partial [Closterium sp. NIES-53]